MFQKYWPSKSPAPGVEKCPRGPLASNYSRELQVLARDPCKRGATGDDLVLKSKNRGKLLQVGLK